MSVPAQSAYAPASTAHRAVASPPSPAAPHRGASGRPPNRPPTSGKSAFASLLGARADGRTLQPLASAASAVGALPTPRTSGEGRPRVDDRQRGACDPLEDSLSAEARLAQRLAPPPEFVAKPDATLVGEKHAQQASVSQARTLEEMLPLLVSRIAWQTRGTRGAARLELGAGGLSGSTVFVQTEGRRVRVQMDVPPGVEAEAWRERIEARFALAGIEFDAVEVRVAR